LPEVGIVVLGVVENESYFIFATNCNKRPTRSFGKGGARKSPSSRRSPTRAIPMDPSVREWGDAGTPAVQAAPGSAIAKGVRRGGPIGSPMHSVHNMSRLSPLHIDRSGGKGRCTFHHTLTRSGARRRVGNDVS